MSSTSNRRAHLHGDARNLLGAMLILVGCQAQSESGSAVHAALLTGAADTASAAARLDAVSALTPRLSDRPAAEAPAPRKATPEEVAAMFAAVKAQRERTPPPFDAEGLLARIAAAGAGAERNTLVLDYLHRVEDLPPPERPAALQRLQEVLAKGVDRP